MLKFRPGRQPMSSSPLMAYALSLACLLVSAIPTAQAQEGTRMQIDQIDFVNMRHPENGRVSGGQPTADQLRAAVDAGLRHVIDLRPESEDAGFDEPALLQSLDVTYRRVPVAGSAGLTPQAVKALDEALADASGEPTMIHCASGNRVGAMMALRAHWLHGASAEDALKIGRDYGLTGMEPAVQQLLGQ